MVHGWTGTCDVTEELQTGGTDDVCEWWLISTSAVLFIGNADPPGNASYTPQTPLVKRIQIPRENDWKDEDSIES